MRDSITYNVHTTQSTCFFRDFKVCIIVCPSVVDFRPSMVVLSNICTAQMPQKDGQLGLGVPHVGFSNCWDNWIGPFFVLNISSTMHHLDQFHTLYMEVFLRYGGTPSTVVSKPSHEMSRSHDLEDFGVPQSMKKQSINHQPEKCSHHSGRPVGKLLSIMHPNQ